MHIGMFLWLKPITLHLPRSPTWHFLGFILWKEYACISVIEEKRTRNHHGISYCFILPYCQHSSYAASIPCLRAVSLVVSSLTTPITCLAHTDSKDLCDSLCWCLTKTGSVSFLVAVVVVHLPTISVLMEIAFAALW